MKSGMLFDNTVKEGTHTDKPLTVKGMKKRPRIVWSSAEWALVRKMVEDAAVAHPRMKLQSVYRTAVKILNKNRRRDWESVHRDNSSSPRGIHHGWLIKDVTRAREKAKAKLAAKPTVKVVEPKPAPVVAPAPTTLQPQSQVDKLYDSLKGTSTGDLLQVLYRRWEENRKYAQRLSHTKCTGVCSGTHAGVQGVQQTSVRPS